MYRRVIELYVENGPAIVLDSIFDCRDRYDEDERDGIKARVNATKNREYLEGAL